jgi:hypothetical protein
VSASNESMSVPTLPPRKAIGCVRIADGPDEVHLSQLGKLKIEELAGRSI